MFPVTCNFSTGEAVAIPTLPLPFGASIISPFVFWLEIVFSLKSILPALNRPLSHASDELCAAEY